jgi:hypothetical protein
MNASGIVHKHCEGNPDFPVKVEVHSDKIAVYYAISGSDSSEPPFSSPSFTCPVYPEFIEGSNVEGWFRKRNSSLSK